MAYSWAPTTADVAQLIADRVLDATDTVQADFSASTIPTAAQVTALITPITEEVHAEAGDIPSTPVDLTPLAKFVATQGVAAWILNSWFSEDPQGPELQRIYEANRDRLTKAVDDVVSSGALGAGHDEPLALYGFPSTATDPRTPITTWLTNF